MDTYWSGIGLIIINHLFKCTDTFIYLRLFIIKTRVYSILKLTISYIK